MAKIKAVCMGEVILLHKIAQEGAGGRPSDKDGGKKRGSYSHFALKWFLASKGIIGRNSKFCL